MTKPSRTTRYNEASACSDSSAYMLLTRWPESYVFRIEYPAFNQAIQLEIGPEQAKRLIKNLTAALIHNKHLKE